MTPQELAQIRIELKMTQEELAKLVGVHRTAIANWERLDGKYPIYPKWEERIRKIHAELGKDWAQRLIDENRQLLAEVKRLEGIIDKMSRILAKPLNWRHLNPRQKKLMEQSFRGELTRQREGYNFEDAMLIIIKQVEREWQSKISLINQQKNEELRKILHRQTLASSISDGEKIIGRKGDVITDEILNSGVPLEQFFVVDPYARYDIINIKRLARGRIEALIAQKKELIGAIMNIITLYDQLRNFGL